MFETIALGKVSTGAGNAREIGFLRNVDAYSADPEQRIADAKRVVLQLSQAGYRPPPPPDNLLLPGAEGIALFDYALYAFKVGGQASEHDCAVGHQVARVLCGGEKGGLRRERDLLDLEREAFLHLCGLPKTRDRIAHMLQTGKPLRN
jgi:3-hydroxyacyl-CoA dehydrogenase